MIHCRNIFIILFMINYWAPSVTTMAVPADAKENGVNLHGRALSTTRMWAALKSECDIAGGSWTPRANNCDTFFGSTKLTCEMTSGCRSRA